MNKQEAEALILSLNDHSENEVLELKEAKQKLSNKEIGKYFSALSNEANLRGLPVAYLIFGVRNDGSVCGTAFMQEDSIHNKGLQRLKKILAEQINNRLTFREINEVYIQGRRVVVFEIPAALRGIPTLSNGSAWAREGESLAPLPVNKIDEIRLQPPHDWSRQIVEGATIDDLDPQAVDFAREKFRERYGERASLVDSFDDVELLDKAGITYKGSVTNTALLLVGKEESAKQIIGALPKVTWTLYEEDGIVRAYQHFNPPFILAIDSILAKVRNEEKRILVHDDSLIPSPISEYDRWSLRELIGNAIAHQAYDFGGKVNIGEFSDKIVFLNEGAFIPGDLETVLGVGYKPPYYRNPFLADAMFNIGMLDQNAMGIRTVCLHAAKRLMPLPTYCLDDPQRVQVELPNHEINETYTAILRTNPDLPILTVLALDKLQKGLPLKTNEAEDLLKRNFAIRDANGILILSLPISRVSSESHFDEIKNDSSEEPTNYARISRKRLSNAAQKELMQEIIDILLCDGPLSRNEISNRLLDAQIHAYLQLSADSFGNYVYRSLKKLETENILISSGKTRAKIWHLRSQL